MGKQLALIPARGGSEGIPGKNLREVAGRPLLAWTIGAAQACDAAVRVVVSTDDEEIARVALDLGAEVPFLRPAELAGASAQTESAVLHCLDALADEGYRPDVVVLLQPTSPTRRAGSIDQALQQMSGDGADSLLSVQQMAPFLWRGTDGGSAESLYDHDRRPLRQEIAGDQWLYRETGSIYVTRTDVYRDHANRLGGRISLFVAPDDEALDIDEEIDLLIAEKILEQRNRAPAC